jgi:CheY-like chemotaxis protein
MSTSKRIFIVDDDIAGLLRRVLDDTEYQSQVCEEIDGAVEKIRVEQPDLVILDLFFHGRLLGLDAYHALRANAMTADLPIIIMTASANEADAMERRLGARPTPDLKTRVMRKPFGDIEDVLRLIEELLDT